MCYFIISFLVVNKYIQENREREKERERERETEREREREREKNRKYQVDSEPECQADRFFCLFVCLSLFV